MGPWWDKINRSEYFFPKGQVAFSRITNRTNGGLSQQSSSRQNFKLAFMIWQITTSKITSYMQ
jgi:hypothetical protein